MAKQNNDENEQRQDLIFRYLNEFRQYGDMLPTEQFDEIVASHLGLDHQSDEFHEIQLAAEEMIHTELNSWLEEQEAEKHAALTEPVHPARKPYKPHTTDEGEAVQYVTVDFNDMEEEDALEADLSIAGKQIDIQVYHLGTDASL